MALLLFASLERNHQAGFLGMAQSFTTLRDKDGEWLPYMESQVADVLS